MKRMPFHDWYQLWGGIFSRISKAAALRMVSRYDTMKAGGNRYHRKKTGKYGMKRKSTRADQDEGCR